MLELTRWCEASSRFATTRSSCPRAHNVSSISREPRFCCFSTERKRRMPPSFLLLLLLRTSSRPFRYLLGTRIHSRRDVPRAFPSPSIAISRVNSRIEAPTSPLARNRHVSIDISRKMLLFFREFSLREYRVSNSRIEPSKFSPSLVKNRDIWIHVFGERYCSSFRNFLRKVSEYTPPDLS